MAFLPLMQPYYCQNFTMARLLSLLQFSSFARLLGSFLYCMFLFSFCFYFISRTHSLALFLFVFLFCLSFHLSPSLLFFCYRICTYKAVKHTTRHNGLRQNLRDNVKAEKTHLKKYYHHKSHMKLHTHKAAKQQQQQWQHRQQPHHHQFGLDT